MYKVGGIHVSKEGVRLVIPYIYYTYPACSTFLSLSFFLPIFYSQGYWLKTV